MPKLTDTQTIILSRAATRPGNLAMPLPEGLHGAAPSNWFPRNRHGIQDAAGWGHPPHQFNQRQGVDSMITDFDRAVALLRMRSRSIRPDPGLTVSEWADAHRWLSSRALTATGLRLP